MSDQKLKECPDCGNNDIAVGKDGSAYCHECPWTNEHIRVIEKSEYDALRAENEKLKAELASYESGEAISANGLDKVIKALKESK